MTDNTTSTPNWKSQKFRDGVFVGAGMVLLVWLVVGVL